VPACEGLEWAIPKRRRDSR